MLIRATALAISMTLAGCAALAPRSVVVSRDELQAHIDKSFPLQRRVASAIDLRIDAPQLALLPDQDRVAVNAVVDATERLFRGSYRGRIAFDSGLRIEPQDASLRLQGVRVADFLIEGPSGPMSAELQRAGAVVAEQWLENMVVWQAKPEQLERLRSAGVQASTVMVTARGIEIGLTRP